MTRSIEGQRRRTGAAPFWLLLLACAVGCASEPAPNVLLITVDTLRADHVGPYATGPTRTPALDRLAEEGVVIEQAFTPTPSTGPAHASLFTGVHPWNHRVLDNAVPMDDRYPTLAELARERGFTTAAFVSSFILAPRFGLDRGFDHYDFSPSEGLTWRGAYRGSFHSLGEETTARAIAWLTEHVNRGEAPFLLWVHYFDPHFPYDPPPRYAVPHDDPVDMAGKELTPQVQSFDVLEQLIRRYRGEVRYADAQIDRLILQLRILGVADRTAVIFTSDHGEGLGDHGHLGHGKNLYDELIRVPLLIRAPGVPGGRRLSGPAQLEDLLPTIAALIGAPVPEEVDGVNLLPWLRGEADRSPREAAIGRRKIYDDQPVLFYHWRASKKWIGPLDQDGTEFVSDGRSKELVGETGGGAPDWLRLRVGETAQSLEDESRPELEPEVERALRALGYVE